MPTATRRGAAFAALVLVLVAATALALTHPWSGSGGAATAAEVTPTPSVDPASLLPDQFGTQCAAIYARYEVLPVSSASDVAGAYTDEARDMTVSDCMANRLEGLDAEFRVPVLKSAVPGLENYLQVGMDLKGITAYWHGEVPQVVKDRIGPIPAGFKVNFVTTGISKAELQRAQELFMGPMDADGSFSGEGINIPGAGQGVIPKDLYITVNQIADWSGLDLGYAIAGKASPTDDAPDRCPGDADALLDASGVTDQEVLDAVQPLLPGLRLDVHRGGCLPLA